MWGTKCPGLKGLLFQQMLSPWGRDWLGLLEQARGQSDRNAVSKAVKVLLIWGLVDRGKLCGFYLSGELEALGMFSAEEWHYLAYILERSLWPRLAPVDTEIRKRNISKEIMVARGQRWLQWEEAGFWLFWGKYVLIKGDMVVILSKVLKFVFLHLKKSKMRRGNYRKLSNL